MTHVTATEAKVHFGKLLDTARRETVYIEKQGRPTAVMVSVEEFERLQAFEDQIWALKAEIARKQGMLSQEESEKLLHDLLNA